MQARKDMFGFYVFEDLAANYEIDCLEEKDENDAEDDYEVGLDEDDAYDDFYGDHSDEYEDIETLDESLNFTASAVPVFECVQTSGKKLWVVDFVDLYRFMECCKITDPSKAVNKIFKDKLIPDDGEHLYAILIPQERLDDSKHSYKNKKMNEGAGFMDMPTKLGELGRFIEYLKNNCINKGIKLVKK